MERFEKIYDVFISHSTQDKQVANAVCNILEQKKIRCWIAPRDIEGGASWAAEISMAIENSRIFLLIYSGHANKSKPVENELYLAQDNCEVIIPFRIEDSPLSHSMKFHLTGRHWLDALTEPREQQINELAEKLLLILPNRKQGLKEEGRNAKVEEMRKSQEEADRKAEEEERQKAEAEAKAEAERLAKEEEERQKAEAEAKAEAERLAKEEEERQKAEADAKAEAERLAKEEEERQKAEVEAIAELERLAKEEERQRAEIIAKAEAERLAKEEKDRKIKEAEAERLFKEWQERQAQAEAKAKAEAERLAKEEEERQRAEAAAKAEAERLAKEEEERQKAEVEVEIPFIEWQDRQAQADVKKKVIEDADLTKVKTGTKEENHDSKVNVDINKAELKKKKEKEVIFVISKMEYLHSLDTAFVVFSIAAILSLIVNKFVEIPYFTPPSLKTVIFLLILSLFTKWSKKVKDATWIEILPGITYLLLSTPITYYFTVLITKDWPWILPYSYFVTVPISWFIIGVLVLALRDEQFFITRFATGCILGFWGVIISESFKLKHVDLSIGIQEVIGNHGFIVAGVGVICILFNQASRILRKENKEEKTVNIEKAI